MDWTANYGGRDRGRVWASLIAFLFVGMADSPGATPAPSFDAYQPPQGYYSTVTPPHGMLESILHLLIDAHTGTTEDQARAALQVTDADPNNPGNMLLVYDRTSLNTGTINPGGAIPGWDGGVSWNLEHTWPDSRGIGGTGPASSDLHHLRAANPAITSARGNKNFGGVYGAQSYGAVTDGGVAMWYPGDADAGMIARQEFYMATRYNGADANTLDLALLPGDPSDAQGLGNLTRMIEWHYHAVPDEFELRRNHIIYTDYQGNRNPYIDNPEYVWSVFVDQTNDSQLYVGVSPSVSGSSSAEVNLGRVIRNAAVPNPQSVTLRRNGNDGTYFRVTTSGSATSSVVGKFNAFPINTTGSDARSLSIGLSTSTTEAGLKSGAVVIDNLDVTSEGGAGRGSNDADDLINVSLSVLDSASPSFFAGSSGTSLILDFGTLTQGSSTSTLSFDIFNRAGALGDLWTAGLDLDGIVETDPGNVFSTSLLEFLNLVAGSSRSATVSMTTAALGSFSGSYRLNCSDEDLPGASTQSMSIALMGNVVAVPEPSTSVMALAGLACGGYLVRRRRKRA